MTFSLLGAGDVGLYGAGPCVAILEYRVYVAPILLYGLEAMVPSKSEINVLSIFHRKSLRRIQFLPESTAIPALHLLIGLPPATALIHIRALSLFRNVIAADLATPPSTYIKEVISRQFFVDCTRKFVKSNPSK